MTSTYQQTVSLDAPLRGASPGAAFRRYWAKFATFAGRASRSEYWWTILVLAIISAVLTTVELLVRDEYGFISTIWGLITLVPSLALGARRLHDIGKSGWWQLLVLIPIVGWIILIVWLATPPKPEGEKYA